MLKPKSALTRWALLTLAASLGVPALSYAQAARVSGAAEREIIRRQQAVELAEENLIKGDELYEAMDYEGAVSQYRGAVEMLPDAPISQYIRATAIVKMNQAALALAVQRIDEGRWQDAEDLVDFVLEYDEENKQANKLKENLEDPEYYNKTKTPTYVAKVEDVVRLLREAKGFYDLGEYDFALKRVDQVLNIDRYNSAARRMQEEINNTIMRESGRDGYHAQRAELLRQLKDAWAPTVRDYGIESTVVRDSGTEGGDPIAKNTEKLNNIVLPSVEFRDATITEALEFLRQQSVRLDPTGEGLNFVLRTDDAGPGAAAVAPVGEAGAIGLDEFGAAPAAAPSVTDIGQKRISVRLNNVPLAVALRYITDLAGLKYRVEQYAVTILPAGATTDAETRLFTREFRVPPDFVTRAGGTSDATAAADAGGGGFFGAGTTTTSGPGPRRGAREVLEASGVSFSVPGSSATFLPSSSKLIVRHTQQYIDLIESIVGSMYDEQPKQVNIQSKFVEVTQNNLSELGFDWLLGAANSPGSDRVFFSGGTEGFTSPPLDNATFPFVAPGAGAPVGTNPVTNGLRSGAVAITSDSIDSLIFPSPARGGLSLAPGVFSVAGVFTDPQFQVVVRALEQKKAVDLLSAPSVTTKSGQRAVIQINREFRYPVEFDPPQIPQDFGATSVASTVPIVSQTPQVFPVTPTTPTAFETKNTGVTLEVEPTVGADGVTIDLNLIPEVIEFEGFINYGSPIQTFSLNALGQNEPLVITPNVINQPVFSVRRVSTNISIWDGSTVVLGGLMREDIQKVEDKVPFLGDLPFIGRLFKSESEQTNKRNLVIFVTATLIDPAGVPIRFQDRLAETPVETLGIPEAAIQNVPEIPLFK